MFKGGTLLQTVSLCLEVLDGFIKQPHPIVVSMVVAYKSVVIGGYDNLIACIPSIMGKSIITKLPKICHQFIFELICNIMLWTKCIIKSHRTAT
jgi:hypothetical protein